MGDKKVREDNKEFKRWILDTHKKLHKLKMNMYGIFEITQSIQNYKYVF